MIDDALSLEKESTIKFLREKLADMISSEIGRMSDGVAIPRDTDRERRIGHNFVEMSEGNKWIMENTLAACIVISLTATDRFELGDVEPYRDTEIGRIYLQARIETPYPYKPDILIQCHFGGCYEPLNIVVECDGPIHDNDKSYRHDRKRDRWMQKHRYKVMRFHTDEIKERGPMDCAIEVLDFIATTVSMKLKRG